MFVQSTNQWLVNVVIEIFQHFDDVFAEGNFTRIFRDLFLTRLPLLEGKFIWSVSLLGRTGRINCQVK